MNQAEKIRLLYFSDPMCSWCYGFAPEISKLLTTLADEVDFQLVMGGLRPYNTETIGKLGSMLAKHWKHVAEKSGQAFNYDLLQDSNFVYDTEPPSRATVVVRHLKPAAEFAFFKSVQAAFYAQNKDTHDVQTYLELIKPYEIPESDFEQGFHSEGMKQKVREDFAFSMELGVRGFPTLVGKKGDQYFLLTNGYDRADRMLERFQQVRHS